MTLTITFGYDGDGGLGDRLIASVLRGDKTATSSLAVEYPTRESLPHVGDRLTLVDHDGVEHATLETTRVEILPLPEVGDDVAHAEGEGFADAAAWRRDHVGFWHEVTHLIREDAADPSWELHDDELVVVHWFRLIAR